MEISSIDSYSFVECDDFNDILYPEDKDPKVTKAVINRIPDFYLTKADIDGCAKIKNPSVSSQKCNFNLMLDEAYELTGNKEVTYVEFKYLLSKTPNDQLEDFLDFLLNQGTSLSKSLETKALVMLINIFSQEEDLDDQEKEIQKSKKELFQILLERGARIDVKVAGRFSAIETLLLNGNLSLLRDILTCCKKEDVASVKLKQYHNEFNLLEYLEEFTVDKTVDYSFLKQYGLTNNLKHAPMKKMREFYIAIEKNDMKKVEKLLKNGAIDLNTKYKGFLTPIGFDLFFGNNYQALSLKEQPTLTFEMFDYLLKNGLDISNNPSGYFGASPVACDIYRATGCVKYLKILHENGYDFNQRYGLDECILLDFFEESLDFSSMINSDLPAREMTRFILKLAKSGDIDFQKDFSLEGESFPRTIIDIFSENEPQSMKDDLSELLVVLTEYYHKLVQELKTINKQ